MKQRSLFRTGGALTAALILLSSLTAMPAAQAATQTAKDVTACNYYNIYDEPVTITQEAPFDVSPLALGVPMDAEVKEVWIDVSMDATSGLPAMPAMGYSAPGYTNAEGEVIDWFGDGIWLNEAISRIVFVVEIPEDAPLPETFSVQMWGEAGSTVDTCQLNGIGFMTGEQAPEIGMATRKGDVDQSKAVDANDAKMLQDYLLRYGDTENSAVAGSFENFKAANGDLDKDKCLSAKDLSLLKMGILDGSLTNTSSDDETAMEFVKHIKLGWNLGNSLDAQDPKYMQNSAIAYETCWGNPMVTKDLIDTVKNAGFNTVRVPVSWGAKMDANYKISDEWMNRVQEIVDYVIDNDMYCILNIHHDNSEASYPYFYPSSAKLEQSTKFVTSVWEQVAERFEAYDNHLIFETLNEPRLTGHKYEWWFPSVDAEVQDAFDCINKLNAAGLEAIRKAGGNNENRFVLMPTYAASPNAANVKGMVLPDDDHIGVEVHGYRPEDFAMNGTATWSEATGAGVLKEFMGICKTAFIDKGVPVVIDEFGAINNNNEDNRAEWAKYYVSLADSYGIPCVWWDNNAFNVGKENLGLINRSTLKVQFPKIMAALLEGTATRGEVPPPPGN